MLNAKTIAIIFAAAAVVVFSVACGRRLLLNPQEGTITLSEFPQLLSALVSTGRNESFWVALVPDTARDDGNYANLQYSIDRGRLGMDWVLIAKRNIEDKEAFRQFVTAAGATVTEDVGNNVHTLRVIDYPDLAKLGQDFLQQVYHVRPEDTLGLIVDGFTWPAKPSTNTSNQAMERTAGSFGSLFSMKFHPQPAATRPPASRRSSCSR